MKTKKGHQAPLLNFQMPQKGTVMKTAKWGTGGLGIAGVVIFITQISFFEPQLTVETNKRIDGIEETLKSIPTDSRIGEIEGKTEMLARRLDSEARMTLEKMHDMELRLMNKIDESARETARLVVAGLKQKRNGEAE